MIKIYLIRGTAYPDEYRERVEILEYEETPKLYIGNGKKLNKNKINKILNSLLDGSFEVYTVDENKLTEARRRIKEQVYQYHLEKLEKEKGIIETLDSHSLESEIKKVEY